MNLEPDDLEYDRLARVWAGESDAAEIAEVERWIAADPTRPAMVARLREGWDTATRAHAPPADVDAAWKRMSARIDAAGHGATVTPIVAAKPRFHKNAWRIAAAILVLIGGATIWKGTLDAPTTSTVTTTAAARSFATAPGERRTITLDDSTHIMLGVASRLDIAAGYGTTSREVTLRGEALFRVQHDASKPFRVNSHGVIIEDMGTQFVVRAYDALLVEPLRVVVTEGIVALHSNSIGSAARARETTGGVRIASISASAGETALFFFDGATKVTPTVNPHAALAWTKGELVFDDALMTRVAEDLERWYGKTVSLAPSLRSRHISTSFGGQSLGEALRAISMVLGARAEVHGDTISFLDPSPPR